jgi:hypothetical protein
MGYKVELNDVVKPKLVSILNETVAAGGRKKDIAVIFDVHYYPKTLKYGCEVKISKTEGSSVAVDMNKFIHIFELSLLENVTKAQILLETIVTEIKARTNVENITAQDEVEEEVEEEGESDPGASSDGRD